MRGIGLDQAILEDILDNLHPFSYVLGIIDRIYIESRLRWQMKRAVLKCRWLRGHEDQ